MLLYSNIGGWTSSTSWTAGCLGRYNLHCRWAADADMHGSFVAQWWNTVRRWKVDADRCRQWKTRAACGAECLCNIYRHLRQFSMSRGNNADTCWHLWLFLCERHDENRLLQLAVLAETVSTYFSVRTTLWVILLRLCSVFCVFFVHFTLVSGFIVSARVVTCWFEKIQFCA